LTVRLLRPAFQRRDWQAREDRVRRQRLARIAGAATHLQVFAISGISAVLLIRAFLAATGYPQLGGGGLHIAHVLWGGLLMMAGLGVTLAFLGEAARTWGAVLGGSGFGTFIDEVGKFVTQSNDYFYRPAAGIIYLVFAALVVLAQWVKSRTRFSSAERTANAMYVALVGATSGLTAEQRRSAVRLVQDSDDPLDAAAVRLLGMVPSRKQAGPWWLRPGAPLVLVDRLARRHPALVVIAVIYLIVQAPLPLIGFALEGSAGALDGEREWGAVIGMAVSALVTVAVTIWGLVRFRRDRLAAFQTLNTALLIDIVFGQVFTFVVNQFSAVPGLIVDVIVWGVISVKIRRLGESVKAETPQPDVAT
jgi:hypothetical protein